MTNIQPAVEGGVRSSGTLRKTVSTEHDETDFNGPFNGNPIFLEARGIKNGSGMCTTQGMQGRKVIYKAFGQQPHTLLSGEQVIKNELN